MNGLIVTFRVRMILSCISISPILKCAICINLQVNNNTAAGSGGGLNVNCPDGLTMTSTTVAIVV